MLAVQNLRVEFGARVLFNDLSFVVQAQERIALAGYNGAGKSTLMKCIAGILEPNAGQIAKPRGCRVGYLPQEGIHVSGKSVRAEVESAFAEVIAMQDEVHALTEQLPHMDPRSNPYAQALDRIGELEILLEHHDMARMRPRVESILRGLGFRDRDFDRDCGEFSGGWQMRLALAKLLLSEPEVLLLDEPTNHLDLDSQRWMEAYLKAYRGAILLISHDIALLDSLVSRTIAFHHGRAEEYAGNFSFFMKESIARKEILKRQYKAQQREIAKSREFIDRFRSKATKASLVQSRIKMLEKVELIQLEDDDAVMTFRFPPPLPSAQSVVRLENVSKCYGSLTVFENFDYEIERGDRIAIVGVNGAGKSTFSRLISGQEDPDAGKRTMGMYTQISFFSQNHADELNPDQTVQEAVESIATREALPNVRNLLGCFLFRGDDVTKRVSVLSGGERSRVALVRMLVQPANFLILDEPTNHLDVQSQEVLQNALKNYAGTYCIVSHNRRFLDPIVTKVLEFRPGLPPRVFLGNISDYIEKKEAEERALAAQTTGYVNSAPQLSGLGGGAGPEGAAPVKDRREQRRREAEFRQRRTKEIKPMEEKLGGWEKKIAFYEQEQQDITAAMNTPEAAGDSDRILELSRAYELAARNLEAAYTSWSEVSDDIERRLSRLEAECGIIRGTEE